MKRTSFSPLLKGSYPFITEEIRVAISSSKIKKKCLIAIKAIEKARKSIPVNDEHFITSGLCALANARVRGERPKPIQPHQRALNWLLEVAMLKETRHNCATFSVYGIHWRQPYGPSRTQEARIQEACKRAAVTRKKILKGMKKLLKGPANQIHAETKHTVREELGKRAITAKFTDRAKAKAEKAKRRATLRSYADYEFCEIYHCPGDCGQPHSYNEWLAMSNRNLNELEVLKWLRKPTPPVPPPWGCARCNTPSKCAIYGCSPGTWRAE